eukprot:4718168-Ditylum_brightwellii.AAC.1
MDALRTLTNIFNHGLTPVPEPQIHTPPVPPPGRPLMAPPSFPTAAPSSPATATPAPAPRVPMK